MAVAAEGGSIGYGKLEKEKEGHFGPFLGVKVFKKINGTLVII